MKEVNIIEGTGFKLIKYGSTRYEISIGRKHVRESITSTNSPSYCTTKLAYFYKRKVITVSEFIYYFKGASINGFYMLLRFNYCSNLPIYKNCFDNKKNQT